MANFLAGRLASVESAARKSPKQQEPSCGLAVVLAGGRRIEVAAFGLLTGQWPAVAQPRATDMIRR